MADELIDYDGEAARIRSAGSLKEITAIVERLPVAALGDDGALYSGKVGSSHSSNFVEQFRGHTSLAIIDDTPRFDLLSNTTVRTAIEERAAELFRSRGETFEESAKLAGDYLYGDASSRFKELTPENCLSGRASAQFVKTLKGDVAVLATDAHPDRIFGAVELEAALKNTAITSLGGIPTRELRAKVEAAHGDLTGVLRDVQTQFREDVKLGVFQDSQNRLVLSKEFAEKFHLTGAYEPAQALEAQGLKRLTIPALPPLERAPALSPPDLARGPAEGAPPIQAPEGLGVGRADAVLRGLDHANIVLNVAQAGYDAARVTQQYDALSKTGNYFAANALLCKEVLVTGGSLAGAIAGSAAVGAGYGALAGSETGPGVLVTGAVGAAVVHRRPRR